MTYTFRNLNAEVRQLMIAEIEFDINRRELYISPRLSAAGRADYEGLFRQAIERHDEDWFAARLTENGRLNRQEQKKKPKSHELYWADMPDNAHTLLAHCEFNRFYMRALCQLAISKNVLSLLIYRAKQSLEKRPTSNVLENTHINAVALLEDLRTNNSQEWDKQPKLGLGKPNSGLSVQLLG